MVSVETMVKQLRNSVMVRLCGEASHEPPLSRPAATLSPPCGERAGRGVPIWFMAPMRVQILEVPPSHEPPSPGLRPPSPLRGERDRVRVSPRSSYHYPKLAGEKWISLISAGLPLTDADQIV